jgi:hypothetical protein
MSSQDDINFINEMFNIVFNNDYDVQNLQNRLSANINGNLINNLFNDAFDSSVELNNYNQDYEQSQEQSQEQNYNHNHNHNYFSPFNMLNYLFYDPIEDVLQESLNMQPDGLEKTDHIIRISSTRYQTLDEKIREENKSCSICIVDFETEDKISITNCNHIFHTDCITEWGKYKTECPICREKLE